MYQHSKIKWREFGAAAMAEAEAANKPIFLTIGYFSCYWCHVMDEKVYSDEATAAFINQNYIPVYVDRDERPDIDEIYSRARELITKQTGWPNHVFLTPDAQPFMACGVLLSGKQTLLGLAEEVAERWQQNEQALRDASNHVSQFIRDELSVGISADDGTPDKSVADDFLKYLSDKYDGEHGGFYGQPKFPHENYLLFLLSDYRHRADEATLDMAKLSLKKMAAGAINDAVGGGFHRYCSDGEWRVPHFEKMLYNQALMGRCYSELYALTGKQYHRDIAEQTLDFTLRELRLNDGLFAAALDAETNGVEGQYYVWKEEDLHNLLTDAERDLFAKCYGLTDLPTNPGHQEAGGKALYARQHLVALANEKNRTYESLAGALKIIFGKLYAEREKRKSPARDEHVIAGWNGLIIDSLARASVIFKRPDYLQAATQAAQSLLDEMMVENTILLRSRGKNIHGFLQDYAYVEAACLTLYDVTKQKSWLKHALNLHHSADRMFWDSQNGGYYTCDGHHKLLVRIHRGQDTGLPAANGVMLHNKLRLWEATQDEQWLAKARMIMSVYQADMHAMPADFSTMIQAMLYLYNRKTGYEMTA